MVKTFNDEHTMTTLKNGIIITEIKDQPEVIQTTNKLKSLTDAEVVAVSLNM